MWLARRQPAANMWQQSAENNNGETRWHSNVSAKAVTVA